MTKLLLTLALGLCAVLTYAQPESEERSAFDLISANRNLSASNYCVYPDSMVTVMTPPPPGRRVFYLSHYGRHGSRYLSNRKGYDIPYRYMCSADSAGLLTPVGQRVKRMLKDIIDETENRWGDLSTLGVRQQRGIARRMVERWPELFADSAHVEARSTMVPRCIMSMTSALLQLVSMRPSLQVDMQASHADMWFLNHQDRVLRDSARSQRAEKVYNNFRRSRQKNPRLMQQLFTNADSARKVVSEQWLNYYLIKTALIQQNTHDEPSNFLTDLFTYEDIHRYWQMENAWWYVQHGASLLNGGHQPYTQRFLLRKMIADADSCLHLPRPGAQLRFGHETVILPLVCLLGINGFDYETADLSTLEAQGWWACLVFPMASNVQFVFYRTDEHDPDVLFKVLLNEQEATLPLPTDMAPYYHWRDFREYYLRKLDAYDRLRP